MTMRCQSLIYGPAERHASGSARVCESGHDSAHWKIIKQTIKDGRRPPPNDLWQLIIYEMEPRSSKKRLAQKLHNGQNRKRNAEGECGHPIYCRFSRINLSSKKGETKVTSSQSSIKNYEMTKRKVWETLQ